MPAILERLTRRPQVAADDGLARLAWQEYVNQVTSFSWNGWVYDVTAEGSGLEGMVSSVHERSNVVAAAVVARGLLMKQTRFAWRNVQRGDPNYRQLFGTDELALLERPDATLSRSEWLAIMEYHASYAGNAYTVRRPGNRLEVLNPDNVSTVIMGVDDPQAVQSGGGQVTGWLHFPGGKSDPERQETILPGEMIHWKPEPHPKAWWVGGSWVTSVLQEISTDRKSQQYLDSFFTHAGTPNLVVKPHEMLTPEQIDEYKDVFAQKYHGAANAFKTLWLGGGSDVTVVGSNIADLDLSNLQGGSETRIAARSRVPASILGIREGMAASALSAGQYTATRRAWADGWYTPTVSDLCAAIEPVLTVPPGGRVELSHDPSEHLFLQEDQADQASIQSANAAAIRQLIDAGYAPDDVVTAIRDNNLSALIGSHTGLTSVQLVPPGEAEANGTDTDDSD